MPDIDVLKEFNDFTDTLNLTAVTSGEPTHSAFFKLYSELAAENGDCLDLDYTPVRKEGRGGYQVDGYAIDEERGDLHLAVCDYRPDAELQVLDKGDIDTIKQRVETFVTNALDSKFVDKLEVESAVFRVAYPIYSLSQKIKRIRVILFSNAKLSTRKPPESAGKIFDKQVVYNYLDFVRYATILLSRGAPEPVEIDLSNSTYPPLRCLQAFQGNTEYESYLVAIPGELLASIYGLYGARLLEQNVRTFLQARTKVNKGIITTIKDNPEMFFAYNNGLTTTASGVETILLEDGTRAIKKISDLQIVNGGQTTASILYAKDIAGADLSRVFVQMKLSVVRPDLIEAIVPKISRYANTQNKISEADFFSSHPLHLALEQMSRRLIAPPKPGEASGSKWFYERARGQYRDGASYGSAQDFAREYPKDQLIEKTDLAKIELTFDCRPHLVCLGAQNCFLEMAKEVSEAWETENGQLKYNENWYKAAVAKALIFRWTDNMIGHADWYIADRGYKAQTLAYTLSWISNHIRNLGYASLNYQLIWNNQSVPDELCELIQAVAPQISREIRNAPANVRNVAMYCRRQACWATIRGLELEDIPTIPESLMLDREELREAQRDAVNVEVMDRDIAFQTLIVNLPPRVNALIGAANQRHLMTPNCDSAFRKIRRGNFNLTAAESRALRSLLDRLAEDGVEIAIG